MAENIEKISRIEDLRARDVIDEVRPYGTEQQNDQLVYIFRPVKDVKGIIFPNDDIISLGEQYSVIINQIMPRRGYHLIFTEVYHSDEELLSGKHLEVRISGRTRQGQAAFRLRGFPRYYLGHLISGDVGIGEKIWIRILEINPGKRNDKFVKADLVARVKG